MYRFIAFTWPQSHLDRSGEIRSLIEQLEQADQREWELAYRSSGLEIWHTGIRPGIYECMRLPNGGVVLGRVLGRSKGVASGLAQLVASARRPLQAGPCAEWLFANAWGSFVGFGPDHPDGAWSVFRDPSGGLPCYRLKCRNFDVLTSNVEPIAKLSSLSLTLDLELLLAEAVMPTVAKGRTGLREIEDVLPGSCCRIGEPRLEPQFLWDPFKLYEQRDRRRTAQQHAELMRNDLREVVEALCRPYHNILHSIGGLDSSILLTCFASEKLDSAVQCINYHTISPAGDERPFARMMAAHAGVKLLEQQLDYSRVDLNLWADQEMGPSPPAGFDSLTLAGDVGHLVDSVGADLLSYGTGGDSIFYQAPFIFSALDYVASGEPVSGFGKVAVEASQYGGRALSSTAWAMMQERLRPTPCFDTITAALTPETVTTYVDEGLQDSWASPDHLHPMLRAADSFPKGKYYHILSSAFFRTDSHRYRFPPGQDVDFICPLVSQPFVELCLTIPTWHLTHEGVSRGLARLAFQHDLPRSVVGRTSKSGSGGVYRSLFAHNVELLREALLDGILARERFFDRRRIEAALARWDDPLAAFDHSAFFDFYAWEIWARRWAA